MPINWNYTRLSGNREGFTLLEILIATFILAVVISTVYAAFNGTFRIIKDSEEDSRTYDMARTTMQRLLNDLDNAAVSGGKFVFIAREANVPDAGFVDLTFASRSHLPFSEDDIPSGLTEITYYIDEDASGDGYRLMRKDSLSEAGDQEGSGQRGFVLCEQLLSLTYQFIDAKGMAHDFWDSSGDREGEKNKVPAIVAIELKLNNIHNRNHPHTFATKVFMPLSTLVLAVP